MDTSTLTRPLPLRHKNEPCCAPAQAPSLSQAQTTVLANRLKALGDTTRLRILDLLAQQHAPLCVCDITPQFSQNQPTISHHLNVRYAEVFRTTAQMCDSIGSGGDGERRAQHVQCHDVSDHGLPE